MNTFCLKMIGIFSMFMDHLGLTFFPNCIWMRAIGRLAFPIFAFLLVEGFFNTTNNKKYIIRLWVFAFLSEIPFDLLFENKVFALESQNVFFTLCFGLVLLNLFSRFRSHTARIILAAYTCVICELLHTDYGAIGIIIILWFYLTRDKKWWKIFGVVIINAVFMGGLQIYAVFALIPILFYNGKPGVKCKKFFYIFYPGHMLFLLLLKAAYNLL